MIPIHLRRLTASIGLLLAAGGAAAEPPIIAKARAFIGPEATLEAVKSLHYVGSLITPDPTDPKKMTYVIVEILVQAPYQQRIVASSDKSVEVTALDGYDAWHQLQNPKDPKQWKMQVFGKEQIKRLRANTWENLAFYRGLEREGGTVIDHGVVTVDGVLCRKLSFVHSDDIVFNRYFDQATGRLVLTDNEAGVVFREQGEIKVDGLRFPKAILTTAKDQNGKEQTITLTFDKVIVNEVFPASQFTVPALTGR